MSLGIGARLGRFVVEQSLGAGGMGEVYQARDTLLGRSVAIKVLPEELSSDPASLERFEREARAIASLSHPNILALHDFGREGATAFAVMELLDGEDLRSRIARASLTPREAMRIALGAAEGLAAAHARGIVHRDLKPANLFLTSDGRVKILDFGLAKMRAEPFSAGDLADRPTVAHATETGTLLGTIGYMAPEQAKGLPADARSDLFALGCILFEMLSGKRAFDGGSRAEILAAVLRDELDPARSLAGIAPPKVIDAIERSLRKEPSDRLQSAVELAGILRTQLESPELPTQVAPPQATTNRKSARTIALLAIGVAIGIAAMVSLVALRSGSTAPPPAKIRTLAVLPLTDLASGPDEAYFADGMTEELITGLSQINGLRVISRASVMRFKQGDTPVREIARLLRADALVVGSVARAEGKIRITAQLVDASNESNIWAKRYERDLRDVLALQGEVAADVARGIRVTLSPAETERFAARRPVDPEAHEEYLRGKEIWNQFTPEAWSRAIELYQSAAERDPTYAAPIGELAKAYQSLGWFGVLAPADAEELGLEAARRALEIDPECVEALLALAGIERSFRWRWSEAEAKVRRAIELSPSSAEAHFDLAFLHATLGRMAEALAENQLARELQPLTQDTVTQTGLILYYARRYDEAIAAMREAHRIDPGQSTHLDFLVQFQAAAGRAEEAFAAWQEYAQKAGLSADAVTAVSAAHEREGMNGFWRALIRLEERETDETGATWPVRRAALHARAGDPEAALDWLERAADEHNPRLSTVGVDPAFDSLRGEARFRALLRRMNLPTPR
ncbi:MAG: protein kinase [Thermoanaerobaculia bacterium]|nr:protein kinase [Thermoanaerobaculia bacterium]